MTTITEQLERLRSIEVTVELLDEVRKFTTLRVYHAAATTKLYRALLIGDVDGPLPKMQVEIRWGPVGGAVSLCDLERFGLLSKHCLELIWQENERKHDAVFEILEQLVILPFPEPRDSNYWPSKSFQVDTTFERDIEVFMNTLVPRLLEVKERTR